MDNPSLKKIPLSVLVLTYNEETNLPYLLQSVSGWVEHIYMVDSGSTDKSIEIGKQFGAEIFHHEWTTYAEQFNWGLAQVGAQTGWLMRMDADEVVMPELAQELCASLETLPDNVTGLYVKRRVHFMGRWIRHGSYYPTWLLRVFRNGKGYCEQRWMDEHIVLTEGRSQHLEHDIIDENHKDLSFWLIKHNGYAKRELLDLLDLRPETGGSQATTIQQSLLGAQDQRKRWMKGNVYQQAPLFWRAWFYFLYRYVVRVGFLDGPEGLIFHVLQGFWYRFYVDALIWEYKRKQREATA